MVVPDEDNKILGHRPANNILGNLLGCACRNKLLTIIVSLLFAGGLSGIIYSTVLLTTQNEQTEPLIEKGKTFCILNIVL